MWCDVVSAATLLYDISYTNKFYYSEEVLELTLDQHGLLVSDDAVIVNRGNSRLYMLTRDAFLVGNIDESE